jgi:hypothetical protein
VQRPFPADGDVTSRCTSLTFARPHHRPSLRWATPSAAGCADMASFMDSFEVGILLCLLVAVSGSQRVAAMLHVVLPPRLIELLTVSQPKKREFPDSEHCYGVLTGVTAEDSLQGASRDGLRRMERNPLGGQAKGVAFHR